MNFRIASRFGTKDLGVCCVELSIRGENGAETKKLSRRIIHNPPFYRDLYEMGFEPGSLPDFELMAAITFVDTVVSYERFADRLLFHELVHVVQYEKLGLKSFAAKYLKGFLRGGSYEAIPLEKNAYELEARFASAQTEPFHVDAEVRAWIDAGRLSRTAKTVRTTARSTE